MTSLAAAFASCANAVRSGRDEPISVPKLVTGATGSSFRSARGVKTSSSCPTRSTMFS